MLRNSRYKFFKTCTEEGTCPITEIWFQLTPESTDDQVTVLEYTQGNYLAFKRSTFESSMLDDLISDAYISSEFDCLSSSGSLEILDD